MIGLVDCNNFFVSCERIFNPKLIGKPVVVLSCNDGCIIARSQEIKALGVPMGAPYFQWADHLKRHGASVCSSNFPLYGDLSNRVMQTLSHFNPELEIYSIDEAFLYIRDKKNLLKHCGSIQQKVFQWTGIPVSIGIASTKTLAKVANFHAKKYPELQGIYFPTEKEISAILENLEVDKVWGIGRKLSKFLAKKGIHTADQLRDQSDLWIKKHLSVVGLRTVWELRGTPCWGIEEIPPTKQSIMTSRSFGQPILTETELLEAVCSYTVRGVEKLRDEKSLASWIQIFIMTSFHHEKKYANHVSVILDQPTDYTPTFLSYVTQGLKSIFKAGFSYKKAGVLLGGLVSKNHFQQDLFVEQESPKESKKNAAMALLDQTNRFFGYKVLQFASEGIERSWQMKKEMCSACFTTRWSDLLTINI